MIKGKSKKELLTGQIAAAVGAGREVAVETVDFSDPNRPKTCLEVDFPIIPINQIAIIEGNAGKPIYQMSKWWARRRSSVFRSMLLAAAMKAPEDESKAAKAVWEVYYANHQKPGTLRHLTVTDPFMGGGTTIVEGSRLGMQMFGCDLNPIAWFVVKNEMAQVDIEEVKRLLADIETEVKPQIMPYFACDGPNGEKGKWFQKIGRVEEELPDSFNIFSVPWQERSHYRYEGPEIIYTFWSKHGSCQREGCGHRTPIMSTPVIAIKTLTIDGWPDWECTGCGKSFTVERHAARMAPDVPLAVAPDEKPFAVMENDGSFRCPHCSKHFKDVRAKMQGESSNLGKSKKKKVELTLLIHPWWLEGCPKHDQVGHEYGGSATDSIEATIRWNNARAAKLCLLEVRGKLPEQVTCPETKVTFYTDERGGTIPRKARFACYADGSLNNILEASQTSQKTGPMGATAIQGYSANLNKKNAPYGGRFFAPATDVRRYNASLKEWNDRKDDDLKDYWPRSALPYGLEADFWSVRGHGYTHWWTMFNSLQLLVHSQLLRAIHRHLESKFSAEAEFVLGLFQQYLRNQCMFTIWNIQADKLEPQFAKNNFRPKGQPIENCVFGKFGRGNWAGQKDSAVETLTWTKKPFEVLPISLLPDEAQKHIGTKSVKVATCDPLLKTHVEVGSATSLPLKDGSVDLFITDPPFGDLLQYSELSDFFYVWLRLVLKEKYPDLFSPEDTPKALEAVENKARHPDDSAAFYQRVLTESWREAHRALKEGGLLAFTFHHSEDGPWVGVLQSLFDAGFYLEATYPIRSDETKGDNAEFGSQKIEYDIIHVCRKRVTEPQPISWARLRRLIMDDVHSIKNLLTQHQTAGLPAADLQVIKRGKALEYFSQHYRQVYIEQGREFTIREALVGINQLLDDDMGSTGGPEAPPANAEPYTRQFFRLFYETTQVPRDQMQKFLRGTGIAPSDFEERGWCSEKKKVFTLTPPVELAQAWKGASRKGMARDFDQTMFLVGACFEGSNIRVVDTLDSPNFAPHPATAELVGWLARHGGSQEIRWAAQRAGTIYRDWLAKNKPKVVEQLKLFDLES
jgi:putative DNA methylase